MANPTYIKSPAGRKAWKPKKPNMPHYVSLDAPKGAAIGYRKASDTWLGRVYYDGSYRHGAFGAVGDTTYSDAVEEVQEWARDVKSGKFDAVEAPPKKFYTLEDVRDDYLTKLRGNGDQRGESRYTEAKKRLNALLPARLLKRNINLITARDLTAVQRAYSQRTTAAGDPISPETVNRAFVHLIAALNHGKAQQMIESNVAWEGYRRLPSSGKKRREQPYIPIKDREAFIKACGGPLKAFVTALHYTAARPSELQRLNVEDVDLKNGKVRLVSFKGRVRERFFPLPEGSPIRMLFESLVEGKHPDQPVFTTPYGMRWTPANLAKYHQAVRDRLKLPKEMSTYNWRHSRITDWVRAGIYAPAIADLAGTSLEHIQTAYFKPDESLQSEMAVM